MDKPSTPTTLDTTPGKKTKRLLSDRERLQRVFSRMKSCCLNPTCTKYSYYGGRGIYICDEWLASGTSEEFVRWALANDYRQGLEADRIDNNGPYAPWNVHFVTGKQNRRNMRNSVYVDYQGQRVLLAELVEQKYGTINKRLLSRVVTRMRRGWEIEQALAPL